MRKTALLFLSAAALASGAHAQPGAITSAYTTLDLDRCTRIDKEEEPQSGSWRCRGYGKVPLIVQAGDERYDIDAGREDEDPFWSEAFDYPGRTVEWRVRGGKPFAIIYRLNASGDAALRTSRLIVETIGGAKPGCRIASIPGGPTANAQARRAADRVTAAKARCLAAVR